MQRLQPECALRLYAHLLAGRRTSGSMRRRSLGEEVHGAGGRRCRPRLSIRRHTHWRLQIPKKAAQLADQFRVRYYTYNTIEFGLKIIIKKYKGLVHF